MFIPMLFVSTFGLVGYAAVDKEAPVIDSNKVEVLYGTKLDKNVCLLFLIIVEYPRQY